jgi:RNA polymerase sigma-70 factor (ECF subfamily)
MMSCHTSQPLTWLPSDEDLMADVQAGNLSAFGQLVVRHQSSAWNAAYRFLGDAGEAEDVAQQAFLKILAAAPRYEPAATFRTYLYRVVTRLCLDHVQKKRPLYTEALPDLTDGSPSPLETMAARELRRDVRDALDRLPPKLRMVVVLRYYEGLGYTEIAQAMQTTSKGVERLLARARAALEKLLEPLLEGR